MRKTKYKKTVSETKLSILHVVESMSTGVLTYLIGLVNGITEYSNQTILWQERQETPKNLKELFSDSIRLEKSKYLTRSLSLYKDLAAFFEIKKIVKEIKPDVIHLHSSKAGFLGRWAINGRNIPLFYTPNGYAYQINSQGKKQPWLYYMLEKISGYRHCHTIACGEGEYSIGRYVTKNISYIDNGIDTDYIDNIIHKYSIDLYNSNNSVCIAARVSEQKNPKLFNEIAELLPDIHFVWIGDGDISERAKLTSLNIEISGWIDREDAIVRICESKVFLLPSKWEGLPLTLLEALYLGRICVVSSIPGNKEVVTNIGYGYICSNLDEYTNIIKNHLLDTSNIQSQKEAVRKNYSSKVKSCEYLTKYENSIILFKK